MLSLEERFVRLADLARNSSAFTRSFVPSRRSHGRRVPFGLGPSVSLPAVRPTLLLQLWLLGVEMGMLRRPVRGAGMNVLRPGGPASVQRVRGLNLRRQKSRKISIRRSLGHAAAVFAGGVCQTRQKEMELRVSVNGWRETQRQRRLRGGRVHAALQAEGIHLPASPAAVDQIGVVVGVVASVRAVRRSFSGRQLERMSFGSTRAVVVFVFCVTDLRPAVDLRPIGGAGGGGGVSRDVGQELSGLQDHHLLVAVGFLLTFAVLRPVAVRRALRNPGHCREAHTTGSGRRADVTLVAVVGIAVGFRGGRLKLLHDRHESFKSRRLAPPVKAVLGRLERFHPRVLTRPLPDSVHQLWRADLPGLGEELDGNFRAFDSAASCRRRRYRLWTAATRRVAAVRAVKGGGGEGVSQHGRRAPWAFDERREGRGDRLGARRAFERGQGGGNRLRTGSAIKRREHGAARRVDAAARCRRVWIVFSVAEISLGRVASVCGSGGGPVGLDCGCGGGGVGGGGDGGGVAADGGDVGVGQRDGAVVGGDDSVGWSRHLGA